MNINFHYYAIKAAGKTAGLQEDQAQLLAEYSQFIDDFATKKTIKVIGRIPQYVVDAGLVSGSARDEIELVTTGFGTIWETIALSNESLQNRMLVPFHFIPVQRLAADNYNDPVTPARIGDASLIGGWVRDEIARYRGGDQNLVIQRLGMVLHIFSDTLAHQRFCGHWNKACNNYAVTRATSFQNPDSPRDVLRKYTGKKGLPAIGHTTVDHAPDDSDISFAMVHQNDPAKTYSRNNSGAFADFAVYIMDELARGLGTRLPFSQTEKDTYTEKFYRGFLADNDNPASMLHAWRTQFPAVNFSYDKMAVMRRLFSTPPDSLPGMNLSLSSQDEVITEILKDGLNEPDTAAPKNALFKAISTPVTEEFYRFTLFAAFIRDAVKPRS